MMREILFRGKRIDNGKWIIGHLLRYENGRSRIIESHTDIFCYENDENTIVTLAYEVDPETVGQFTGLVDKNGNKIFEGDIVHCVSMTDMANMVVIFEDGEFRMVLCEKYKEYIPGCGFYAIRCFDKEVIGNIHDNPELIGGGNDG